MTKLSLKETESLVLQVLADNPATLIIDAMDECDPRTRHFLFEFLDTAVKVSSNVVKVFLTSRNESDIVCRLRTTPNIYIDMQKNEIDIRRFIDVGIKQAVMQKRLLNGQVSEALQSKISSTLDSRARGMYVHYNVSIIFIN